MTTNRPSKGGWVVLRYPTRTKICDQVMPPRAASSRRKDIEARYSESPFEVQRCTSVHWDAGGSIFLEFTRQHINFNLAGNRTIHIWAHYLEDFLWAVRGATAHEIDGKSWRRIYVWPGRHIYLSAADIKKLLRATPAITEDPAPTHEVVP